MAIYPSKTPVSPWERGILPSLIPKWRVCGVTALKLLHSALHGIFGIFPIRMGVSVVKLGSKPI